MTYEETEAGIHMMLDYWKDEFYRASERMNTASEIVARYERDLKELYDARLREQFMAGAK